MNYTGLFDYLMDCLADIGDEIVSRLSDVPEWMDISFDVLQNKIGTLWGTYANIEVTECSDEERQVLFTKLDEFIYEVVGAFITFSGLVENYLNPIE